VATVTTVVAFISFLAWTFAETLLDEVTADGYTSHVDEGASDHEHRGEIRQ
jgi:hypothetical protein